MVLDYTARNKEEALSMAVKDKILIWYIFYSSKQDSTFRLRSTHRSKLLKESIRVV